MLTLTHNERSCSRLPIRLGRVATGLLVLGALVLAPAASAATSTPVSGAVTGSGLTVEAPPAFTLPSLQLSGSWGDQEAEPEPWYFMDRGGTKGFVVQIGDEGVRQVDGGALAGFEEFYTVPPWTEPVDEAAGEESHEGKPLPANGTEGSPVTVTLGPDPSGLYVQTGRLGQGRWQVRNGTDGGPTYLTVWSPANAPAVEYEDTLVFTIAENVS